MTTLNINDYAALKALYESTNGSSWRYNNGWKDWDFTSATPPELSVVENWHGVTLEGDRVKELVFNSNRLSGEIPTELGNLTNLEYLDLGYNQLSGEIPAELGNLTNLQSLNLHNNQLSGEIPAELSNLTSLQLLNLFRNQLSGEIPAELGNLANLQSFNLFRNQLSGEIPAELGNLANLVCLYLNNNQLSGEIPTELSNLAYLEELYLSDNQLSGEISTELQTFIDNLRYPDIQNPPYEISLTNNSVDENLDSGTIVGLLESKDINSEDEFSYELVSGEGDTDNALFEIVYDELQTKAVFDYETKHSYSIRVQTHDDNGGTFEQQLTIYINDAPDEEVNIIGDLIEDSTLFAEVFDPDGIASSIEYQWQSSKNGITWTDIAGATDETFTPGDEEAGQHLQVNVSYSDYDGNFESLTGTGDITFDPVLAGISGAPDSGLSVVGDYAYIADINFLQIVDISNPHTPTLVSRFDTNGYAEGISVVGDYAYIANYDNGLQIVDISNPQTPTFAGAYHTNGYTKGISVVGDYAYIANYDNGLQIVDISNPQTPTLASTHNTDGFAYDVSVAGNYAYIANGIDGLTIVDISNPHTPTLASTFGVSGYTERISVARGYAYMASGSSGLNIVDISNPHTPTLASTHNTDGFAYDVSVAGDYAYIADGSEGLKIVDISNPRFAPLVGDYSNYDRHGSAKEILVVGDYAYVDYDNSGLEIINLNATIPVVENINDEPTGVTLNNTRIAEQSKTGRVVGRLSTVDPDPDDFHTYTLINDAGGRFALSEDNKLVVADGGLLDAGSNSSHVVTVKTTDSEGYSYYEEELTIDVIEVVKPKGDATDNILEGTSAIDVMRGLAGDDTLNGYADNDILNGGTGADIMTGGTGNDAYFVDDTADQVIEAVDEGIDRVISFIDYTLPENVEKLILRGNEWINGTGNDLRNVIKGNDAENVLEGNGGNDRLFGNGGDDELFGGAGRDILDGGDGLDMLTGGSGRDRFILSSGYGDDMITDFQDGQDRLQLVEGLTFESLTIEAMGFNYTAIRLDYEILATLEGVDASLITSEDFI